MKPGVSKRAQRIAAADPSLSKRNVRQLAKRRAKTYQSRLAAQASNKSEGIGRGKAKGTLKRKLWKAGGTKSELKALKVQPKTVRKSIKKNARKAQNYDLRGTADNMKKSQAYKSTLKQGSITLPGIVETGAVRAGAGIDDMLAKVRNVAKR
jgi:hypothetical protein